MTESTWQVMSYAAAWMVFSLCSGYLASRIPDRQLDHDTRLTRIRSSERAGSWYRRIRVDRWKDWLPEAGGFFPGGRSKAHVGGRSLDSLRIYAVETRRAEWVHWAGAAFGFTFFLWTDTLPAAINAAMGVIGHAPFIVVQRFNRSRVIRMLDRRSPGPEMRPAQPAV